MGMPQNLRTYRPSGSALLGAEAHCHHLTSMKPHSKDCKERIAE